MSFLTESLPPLEKLSKFACPHCKTLSKTRRELIVNKRFARVFNDGVYRGTVSRYVGFTNSTHDIFQKDQPLTHHTNIFEVMGNADEGTWTHYTLCDAIDWMPCA